MGKLDEYVQGVKQHHHANVLRRTAVKEYEDDPDVVFHDQDPESQDAPHGVNTPEEMSYSADPVAD